MTVFVYHFEAKNRIVGTCKGVFVSLIFQNIDIVRANLGAWSCENRAKGLNTPSPLRVPTGRYRIAKNVEYMRKNVRFLDKNGWYCMAVSRRFPCLNLNGSLVLSVNVSVHITQLTPCISTHYTNVPTTRGYVF